MDLIVGAYNYRIVGQYLDQLALGLMNTLWAAMASLVLSLILGTLVAMVRMARNPLAWRSAAAYIQFVRATPLLIQIYLVYYGLPALVPATRGWSELSIGIVALTLHTAPYMAEIIRAGIESVPRGQVEGAMAVGMGFRARMQHVVLPQAFANTLPPLLGQTAVLIKDTSLLSIITVFDLMAAGLLLNSERIKPNEAFLTIAVVYLAIYVVMLVISHMVQRRLAGPAWNAAR